MKESRRMLSLLMLICLLFAALTVNAEDKGIGLGDKGETIAILQRRLSDMGYFESTITGVFDDATKEAVEAFQEANGLEATGIADPETIARMYADDVISLKPLPTPTPAPKIYSKEECYQAAVNKIMWYKYNDPSSVRYTLNWSDHRDGCYVFMFDFSQRMSSGKMEYCKWMLTVDEKTGKVIKNDQSGFSYR